MVLSLQLAVASNANGALELFALGEDHQAYHMWQQGAGNNFGGWASLEPPPPPQPPQIAYFKAEPDDGRISVGLSGTLSWAVTNVQGNTVASLQGKDILGTVLLNKHTVPLQGSQIITPVADTKYTLTASDNRGQGSGSKWVTLYGAPIGPPQQLFCFKFTSLDSFARPCFTECFNAPDETAAREIAKRNQGYTAEIIDPSQAGTACG